MKSVDAYLERLPHGAGSFPEVQVKGAVVCMALRSLTGRTLPASAPACVASLVREPPPVNTWIPEAHYGALLAAIRELRFSGPEGLVELADWMFIANRELLQGALYRVLFMVVSPERVFQSAGARWSAFHRGTTLTAIKITGRHATMRLEYPPSIFDVSYLASIAAAFRAAGFAAGARDLRVQFREESARAAVFEADA